MNTNTMTRISTLAVAIGLAFSVNVWAAETATQDVGYEVAAISQISVTNEDPGSLVITGATPGLAPTEDDLSAGTYAITNNAGTKKITAAIDSAMPSGVTLEVELQAPAGASTTRSELSTSSANVVTAIGNVSESGKTITYYLNATAAAGAVSPAEKTVTFTITGS